MILVQMFGIGTDTSISIGATLMRVSLHPIQWSRFTQLRGGRRSALEKGPVCLWLGFRSDSSFNFMTFFFICGVQFVLSVVQAIGISGWGACGWLAAVTFFSYNVGAAIVMLFPAVMFTVSAIATALALVKVGK
ncbi:hypothetical protein AB205_0067460 [Aquarana catesbeiana]|uniref:Secretory carrier-associated membrane protein n=1 Tax=Aquarana catesbeiana TaxID=8400 RepID=A0A2G9QLE3_AQUCT|nr:hypothetical protein AB205_0067460 [Aquarana catesbeiana]